MIEQLFFTFKLFVRIFLFALFGYMFAYGLDLNPIAGYRVIIGFAVVGTIIGIDEVLRRMGA